MRDYYWAVMLDAGGHEITRDPEVVARLASSGRVLGPFKSPTRARTAACAYREEAPDA